MRAARYVVNQQRDDGSWAYGADASQSWIDNFHTAYLLSSLHRIIESCEAAQTDEFREPLQRGYEFWRDRFFLADGWAKYYHDTLYPVDTHAAATAIASFLDLTELDRNALPRLNKSRPGRSTICATGGDFFITSVGASTLPARPSCGGHRPGCFMRSHGCWNRRDHAA